MLIALCQLGALRLDTNRAFISLLDHTQQYIIGNFTYAPLVLDGNVERGHR